MPEGTAVKPKLGPSRGVHLILPVNRAIADAGAEEP